MNAKEFNESINKIDVDEKTKEGILELIDVKTLSNMKPIINEIRAIQEKSDLEFRRIQEKSDLEFRAIQEKSDSGFKIINSEFRAISSELKAELKAIQEKSDSEFKISNSESKRIEDKIDTKTTMLMWDMGIIMGLIGILITILVASKFIH